MRRLYQYDEQKRHPHLLEEHYFNKLNPSLVYAGVQEDCPGPQNVLHTHPFVEVAFFWQGCGYVILDGQRYPVQKGDIMVFNAGRAHCEYSDEKDPLSFYFTAYDKLTLPNLPQNQLLAGDVPPILHTGDMADTFYGLFGVVLKELEEDKDFGYEIAQGTAKIIVMHLFRLLNQSYSAKDFLQANKVLQDALKYIDDNFNTDISLDLLAGECMVSKYYLSHLFTKRMGKSVGRYILDKRVFTAKQLLSSTDLSVEQISQRCGFADSAYFCRLFKKETGKTPTQFRRK